MNPSSSTTPTLPPADSLQDSAADLYLACKRLLECPDLCLDELEEETIEAIRQGEAAIRKAEGKR